jgi:hypothetical protein
MKAPKPPFKTTASLFVVLIVCGVLFSADTEVCKKCSCEWKLVAPACFLLGCFTENNTCDDNTLTLSFDASLEWYSSCEPNLPGWSCFLAENDNPQMNCQQNDFYTGPNCTGKLACTSHATTARCSYSLSPPVS